MKTCHFNNVQKLSYIEMLSDRQGESTKALHLYCWMLKSQLKCQLKANLEEKHFEVLDTTATAIEEQCYQPSIAIYVAMEQLLIGAAMLLIISNLRRSAISLVMTYAKVVSVYE